MLKEQIKSDSLESQKSGDVFKLSVLRLLSASVLLKEKDKRYKEKSQEAELTDEEIIGIISSEIKKRKDAVSLYEKGGRQELAEKEKKEIEILLKYLPEQMGDEELKKIIEEAIKETGAKEIKDMGKVMANLMPKIKGKADSGEVSKIIKELLGK